MKLIENAREAFEFSGKFIPTELKIQYLNQLLDIGYFAVDMGRYNLEDNSHFSDLEEVICLVDKKQTKIIISTETRKETLEVAKNSKVDYIEIPFSLLDEIKDVPLIKEKAWVGILVNCSEKHDFESFSIQSNIKLCEKNGIKKIKLYNSSKEINKENIEFVFKNCRNNYPDIEFGVHFYAEEKQYKIILESAYLSEIQFFESSIKGWAKSELGNTIPTEKALTYLIGKKEKTKIDILALESAYNTAKNIFSES